MEAIEQTGVGINREKQQTIIAADKVNHFISVHLHEKFDEANIQNP